MGYCYNLQHHLLCIITQITRLSAPAPGIDRDIPPASRFHPRPATVVLPVGAYWCTNMMHVALTFNECNHGTPKSRDTGSTVQTGGLDNHPGVLPAVRSFARVPMRPWQEFGYAHRTSLQQHVLLYYTKAEHTPKQCATSMPVCARLHVH
jgi:hypothetical protein